jgi:hypothetical protein
MKPAGKLLSSEEPTMATYPERVQFRRWFILLEIFWIKILHAFFVSAM